MRPFFVEDVVPQTCKSAVVVTPTIGEAQLSDAIASVQRQTYRPLRHLIVVDGAQYKSAVVLLTRIVRSKGVEVNIVVLPKSTGSNGYYGNRICGASAYLVDEDVVLFLDADNVFREDHVASCMAALQTSGCGFVYSLRQIVNLRLKPICLDQCDSLGHWPRYPTHYIGDGVIEARQESFLKRYPCLIDTSCYAFRRMVLVRWSRLWYGLWGTDNIVGTRLLRCIGGVGTGLHTLHYRIDTEFKSDIVNYFLDGNQLSLELYGYSPPWERRADGKPYVTPPHTPLRRFGEGTYRGTTES